jgi:ATP-dependent helicase/nuclease subunit B
MTKFTDQIASYIFENDLDLKELVIILPSERAKKYLTASLFDAMGKPLLAPQILTIDQWIRKLSNRTIVDRTRILLRFYEIYLKHQADPSLVSFDEFMSWGTTLLSDFEEIDRYMLSPTDVFRNLQSIHELESWSFLSQELTEGQKKFMEFWELLPCYYTELNARLDQEGICYSGSAYAWAAQNLDVVFRESKQRVFLFAGFNALSAAEKSIISQLYKMGRAHVLIDADEFYLKDTNHEAGRFLRELMDELKARELPFVMNEMSASAIDVEVIECAQHTGQVKVASTILAKLSEEERDETLVLLADEQLITPLLRNLPKQIGNANITLGLPLQHTALKTWVELAFNIQENRNRFKTNALYINDLQRFWNHPFTLLFLDDNEKKRIVSLEQELIRRNSIFVRNDRVLLSTPSDELVQLVFSDWSDNWLEAVRKFRMMNTLLYGRFGLSDDFEKAIIETFEKGLIELENLIQEGLPELNLKSFKLLFFQHWSRRALAYHGNPLEGVQIMGLLETRLLDFKKIIVLGLNEGAMPPLNPVQTMIPMDLRNYLKLPTPREKQGLFAHHFYRLLHRCEQMWITYTSSQESIGSNEASRYILQMELEWSRMNKNMRIHRSFYAISNEESVTEAGVSIEKTDEIIQRLDEFFQKPVSASGLNKFITCPLDFYYRYLLEFGEEETVEEEVESNTFGTFIHNVLELLYTPFARHEKNGDLKTIQPPNLTTKDVEKMLKEFKPMMVEQFMKHFDNDATAFQTGRNLLSFEMACELTERILKKELTFLEEQSEPVFIEFIEVELRGEVEIELDGEKRAIPLRGFVDRIDSIGGRIRIIDYKSGKVKESDVRLSVFESTKDIVSYFSSTKHAVQLAFYTFLYHQKTGNYPTCSSIYSLVNLNEGLFELQANEMTQEELMELFPSFVQGLISEIYDKNKPFAHQPAAYRSWCQYCE